MFNFSPPEAEHQIDLVNNRFIVCYGNSRGLLTTLDWLSSKGCQVHARSSIPPVHDVRGMAHNAHLHEDAGVVVLWISDPGLCLTTYVEHHADLILYAENMSRVVVQKNRAHSANVDHSFSCCVTNPTGRILDPTYPRLQNMSPRYGFWGKAAAVHNHKSYGHYVEATVDGPSMGTAVAKDECTTCEPKGSPSVKPNTLSVSGPKPLTILNMSVDQVLTLVGPDGREFVKINAEGEAFVRGEKVAAGQQDIYEMFRAWVLKTVGSVPLPTPGVVDAQGEVFTQEAVDRLRKQVDEQGLLPMPKQEIREHDTQRRTDQTAIMLLHREMRDAHSLWEKGQNVGDIMQRLADVADGRVQAGSARGAATEPVWSDFKITGIRVSPSPTVTVAGLSAEIEHAIKSWQNNDHVGDIFQRLTYVLEGKVIAGNTPVQARPDDRAYRWNALVVLVRDIMTEAASGNLVNKPAQWWDDIRSRLKDLGVDAPRRHG